MVADKTHASIRAKTHFSYFAITLIISLLIGYSYYWNITNIQDENIKLAYTEAKANWNKDDAFRKWSTRHGGVYVKPSERTPPSPSLANLPNRDLVTRDGTQLTLMNPAYMMRQMTQEFEELYGIKGKVTGKLQLNSINKPDPWQLKVLNLFESENLSEYVEETRINGEPFIRYMRPLYMEEGCIQCHGVLGFKVGDLRGGVSVSVPLAPYISSAQSTQQGVLAAHLVIWLIAIITISFFIFVIRRLLKQSEFDALHDELTQLSHIKLFRNRVDQRLSQYHRYQDCNFTVCIIDLDSFKHVNDVHGHHVGDQLLVELATRFRKLLRSGDTIARWGGDEFIFLLDNTKDVHKAIKVIERIRLVLREPICINSLRIFTDASIGICISESRYGSADEMIRDADLAMFKAKEAGKRQLTVFDPMMQEEVLQRAVLENDLRDAIKQQQLAIHYQPVINIENSQIQGFEALLRWQHPILGNIAPDKFIPIAERSGQILQIGQWVIEQACRQVAMWNRQYDPDKYLTVSVNLSGSQLAQIDLTERIEKILQRENFAPELLHLEVTETMLIEQKDVAKLTMEKLRALGASISIDDFGTGYCSLSYLQEYDFDTIKIDKSFIEEMTGSKKALHLVNTLTLLAKNLDMNVIAEGVETEEQLSQLARMNCPLVQGYYFSKPLPSDEMAMLLPSREFSTIV